MVIPLWEWLLSIHSVRIMGLPILPWDVFFFRVMKMVITILPQMTVDVFSRKSIKLITIPLLMEHLLTQMPCMGFSKCRSVEIKFLLTCQKVSM